MKIVCFNINGLRARPHQLAALIEKHQPDVIGLQETKVSDDQFPLADVEALGYHVHYHGQKGHYGVALLSRQAPLSLHKGLPPMKKRPSAASSGAPSPMPMATRSPS